MDDREKYIFGISVVTDICTVRFLKYHEYVEFLPELSTMSMNILHIYYQYKNSVDKNDERINDVLEDLKKDTLYNVVVNNEMFADAYLRVFKLVIDKEEAIEKIFDDEKLFMQYRKLILDMQILSEEEVSPNLEIQKAIERSRRVKQKDAEKQSYGDIISSIVAGTSNSFDDVVGMTVYQVYSVFYRMSAIFNYQTSSLFATVAEKVKIEAWNKHIDLFKTESDTIEQGEFNKKFGSMFS